MNTDPQSWPEFERNATYERNAERSSGEPCARCGKEVKGLGAGQIHLTGDDTLAPVELADEDFPHDAVYDMGWFSVGPDCAKKLPAGYVEIFSN